MNMRVFYRTAAFLAVSLALVCRFGAGVPAQAAVTIEDNFSRYAEGSDAGAAWETGDIGWAVQQGAFASDGADRSNAYPKTAPYARRMVVETTVWMQRPTTGEWKLAGLSVVRDGSNYWHLALVEKPDGEAKAHFVEMCEMLGGGWLANLNGGLKVVADRGQDFNWQYDHPYRLRIELTPEGITGTVSELNGVERVRKSYAFNAKAVTTGRPSLVTSNMAANFDDFRADIAETAEAPAKPIIPAYTRLTANPVGLRGKRTGFFHVERKDGRWWVIDPAGEAFYIVGTDHVNYNGMHCEKLGYSPYHRNVAQKYGSEEKWAANATARLKQWGFNSLGAGCAISARHQGMAHTTFLSLGAAFSSVSDIVPKVHWTGFPNVFDPRFASWCERKARQICTPEREDPWLLGYFLDNELEWYGKNGSETGMVDEVFKKPATHSAKQALIRFLRGRYPTIAAFNRAWGTTVTSYDALAATTEPLTPRNAAGQKDCRAFVRLIAERYFAVTTAAIRKADPNHMILGCRFAGRAPGVWDIAGKYLDIVSVNYYGHVDMERGISTDMPQAMAKYYADCKRPMMMTEWSFPALDAGLPSEHGAGQRVPTQKDKARCYSIYQQKLFSLPFMVGSDYFMWVDQPALGIASTFPEDSNYGLVDEWDNAWPDLTQTATRVNPLAYALHAGRTAELSVQIRGTRRPVLRVRNAGTVSARCPVVWWIQGIENRADLVLAPGAGRDIPLEVEGNAFVAVTLDPEGSVLESDKTDNTAEKVFLTDSKPAVVAINSSATELRDVPLAVKLGKRGTKWQVVDAVGRAIPAQIDALPGGFELALRAPALPARSVTTFRLLPGETPQSIKESSGDRSFVIPGPLRLEHDAGSGNLLDRVLLGDLQLGRFTPLVHQSRAQSLWVPPDRVEQIESYTGPVRTVLLLTAALSAPERGAVKTAVDAQGAYSRQEEQARRYRIRFQISQFAGESWFGARFLGIENTDTLPWGFRSYYHYPVSCIGGKAEDDQAENMGNYPCWKDTAAGAVYGAVVDTTRLKVNFWKDTPEGAGEHPDIWRELDKELQPGQALPAASDEPEVLLYGARINPDKVGNETMTRLRALVTVQTQLK